MNTYKVLADFSARAGEYILVVNGICVGVVEKAVIVKSPVNPDSVYDVIKHARMPINAASIARELDIERDLGARAAVSIYIRELLKSGKIKRAPGAGKLGPYEVNSQ
jgi:hypothetical protein